MAIFGWVPFRDTEWQIDMMGRAQGVKVLPMADGSDPMGGGTAGQWNQIVAGDTIMIAAHGRKYTTETVAWVVGGQVISWSAQQMAQEMWLRLGAQRSGLALDYRLLACFGANNITPFAESFGERLSKEMKVLAMRGSLTAYKGATGILGNRGRQIGDSRITCAMSIMRHGLTANGKPTADSSKVWPL